MVCLISYPGPDNFTNESDNVCQCLTDILRLLYSINLDSIFQIFLYSVKLD